MKDIQEYISEGILDRKSTVVGAALEASLEDLKKYVQATGSRWWEEYDKIIKVGPNGLELGNGDDDDNNIDLHIRITDVKPNLQISYVYGDLTIEDSKIQTLEGIFTPDCEFAKYTTLIIKGCNKLISTKGLPKSLKNLNIIIKENNPNIRFDDLPGDFEEGRFLR